MVNLKPEEVGELLSRLESGSLTEQDRRILKAILGAYLLLSRAVQEKSAKIKKLLGMIFGVKTERAEVVLGGNAKRGAKEKPEGRAKKAGHGRYGASSYTGAKRIRVAHPSLSSHDACPACQRGKLYPISPPGVSVRISGIAPLQAELFEREKLRCNLCGELFTAPLPEEAGKDKYDESAGAMIAILKYGAGFPFNRLDQLQESLGVPVSASTLWDIVEKTADRIYPVHEELIREAAQGEIIHNDDTTMKILALAAESDGERSGSFTTGMLSIVGEKRIVLFATGRKHAGENLGDLLAQREPGMGPPIQMCDALSRNTPKELATLLANCLAHARRNFVEQLCSFPEECRIVIETLRDVYQHDKSAREANFSPRQRLDYHQQMSAPLMEGLRAWMNDQMDAKKVEPNSGLGKAISYMINHWEPLTLFLRTEGAPLDNNLCEQVLKRAILHRRNSLFYKTTHGAYIGDLFMSLIATCRLSKINPFDYLVALQKHSKEVFRNPRSWLPWNYTAALPTSPA
jgi:hypothetical protein